MTVRGVLCLPHSVLERPSVSVNEIDGTCRALAADLIDTMQASPACVGLAAPQIGVGVRALVVDVSGHRKATSCHGMLVLFNPVVISTEAGELAREGCMSVPELTGDVARPTHVVVSGLDLAGRKTIIEAEDFEARALLHEIDHLDGLVFLDRVSGPSAVFQRRTYR